MFKLANQVLDVYDDVDFSDLRKIASLNPSVNVMTPDEHANLRSDDFALSVITKKAHRLNKFPVDSGDNTWLSNQYFEMNAYKLPEVAAGIAAYNIKQACARFGITPTPGVIKLARKVDSNVYCEEMKRPVEKKASRVQEVDLRPFADVARIGDNETHAQYVFATPAHVKVACHYFEKQLAKIPADYRHKYAAAIQKRAGELGMGPQGGTVAKYAGDHYSSSVDAHIRARVSLTQYQQPELAGEYTKLAAAKVELTPAQFAQAMFGLDKKAGLSRHYGGHLTNPFEATFAQQPDRYAGYRTKVAGRVFTSDDLRRLATEKYAKIKDYFGQSMADEFKKEPTAIFDSLPMDAQSVMAGIANGTA